MATTEPKKTGLVRASFVQNLYEARAQEAGQTPKFGCTLLIPKTDSATLKMLQDLVLEACVAAGWGDAAKVKDLIGKGLIKLPVLDGDGPQGVNKKTGERHPGYEGHFFVRATSGKDYQPKVVDERVQPIMTHDPSRFKSGDWGYAAINAFTWDHTQNGKGVTCGIAAFQKIKSGDSLGGAGGVDTGKFFQSETVEGEAAPEETKDGAGAAGLFG